MSTPRCEGEIVMIINASRRTDIPAFYLDWFINRLKEGYALVRNTMNPDYVMRVDLNRENIDCIVFWTKDPTEFLERQSFFEAYPYYFQVSLTGYDQTLEPFVREKDEIIASIIRLSKSIGKKRVVWRYDPILFTHRFDVAFHIAKFEELCRRLSGYTERCVISFVDMVETKEIVMEDIGYVEVGEDEMSALASRLVQIAAQYGIAVESCSEAVDLDQLGIKHGKCVDDQLMCDSLGVCVEVGKDKHRREMCGCVTSVDIGVYNSCGHDCFYCYANFNHHAIKRNRDRHSDDSPLLADILKETDTIVKHKNA
jgi:hypothetical protein